MNAQCRDFNGNYVEASIYTCDKPVKISNCGGVLMSGDCPPPPPAPPAPSPSNNCPGRSPNDGRTCADCPAMTVVSGMNCRHL